MSSVTRKSPESSEPPPSATCPNCWATFEPGDAFFIASHPELVGDPILGEHVRKRLAPREVQREGNVIKDPKGFPVEDRACPACRLQVPTEMLFKQPLFMSMAGAPKSGKTYYITALIRALRQQLPRDFNFNFEYAISDDIKAIDELISRLYESKTDEPIFLEKTDLTGGAIYNQIVVEGQKIDLPKPFLFALRPTPSNIDFAKKKNRLHQHLAFYDCAGEHFQYDYLRQATRNTSRAFGHFAHANALMFTYDPLQDQPAIQRLAPQSTDPQVGEQRHVSSQDKTLEAVVQQFRKLQNLRPNKRIKAPLLVCVQKYDVWGRLVPKWARLDDTSVVRFPSAGTSALDVQELNRHSLHIRKFLHDISPMFVAQAESNFSLVRYFAVSALGTSPFAVDVDLEDEYGNRTRGTKLCVRPRDLHAFRVTDPILWLLAYWNLIRKALPRSDRPDEVPEAEIASSNDGVIRVVLPDSRESLVVDEEYLGTQIVDPFAGTPAWIPAGQSRKPGAGWKSWFGGGGKSKR